MVSSHGTCNQSILTVPISVFVNSVAFNSLFLLLLGLAEHVNAAALVILSFPCRVYLHDVDVVEKNIFDADELGALAEEANHEVFIQPPWTVVHVEVRSRNRWGNVCKPTLFIAPYRYISQCSSSHFLCSPFRK